MQVRRTDGGVVRLIEMLDIVMICMSKLYFGAGGRHRFVDGAYAGNIF